MLAWSVSVMAIDAVSFLLVKARANPRAFVMSAAEMSIVIVMGVDMTNIEALKHPPKRDNRCGTLSWIISLPDAAQKAIDEALHNPDWRSTDLHKLLQDSFGYELGYNQFLRHRKGVCCG
jgi:hypothetical protein